MIYPRNKTGFVYFVWAPDDPAGLVKIGFTRKSPEERIAALQIGCPLPLKLIIAIRGSYEIESELHARFSRSRRHGEWFTPSEDLIQFVKDVSPQYRDKLRSMLADPKAIEAYSYQAGCSQEELIERAKYHLGELK